MIPIKVKIKAGKRELESTDFRDLEQIEAVEIVSEYEVDEQSDDEFLNDKIYSNEKTNGCNLERMSLTRRGILK